MFFLLIALRLWLVDIPGLLYSTTGPLVGASYTDLHASLPALRRLRGGGASLAAVAVVVGAVRGRLARYALWAVGGYLVVGLHRAGALPARDAEASSSRRPS